MEMIASLSLFILMFVLFYFLLIQTKPETTKSCSYNARKFAKRRQDRHDWWTPRYS